MNPWLRWPLKDYPGYHRVTGRLRLKGTPTYWHAESGIAPGYTICGKPIPRNAEMIGIRPESDLCRSCASALKVK